MSEKTNNLPAIPLVIISTQTITAEALQALLQSTGHYDVFGLFTDGPSCIKAVTGSGLDCTMVLLDMEGEDALQTITQLMATPQTEHHRCRILALTGSGDVKLHDAAITAGASGVVRKNESSAILFKAIDRVAKGELWMDRATTGRIFQTLSRKKQQPERDPEQDKIETLTRKERSIISEIAGMPSASGQELAARLHISEHTLRNHLSAIYAKLNVANRTDLYAYARQHQIKAPAAKQTKV